MLFHLVFGLLLFYIRDPHLYLFWPRVGPQRIKNCAVQTRPQVCKSGGKCGEGQFLVVSSCLPEACKGLSYVVFIAIQLQRNISTWMAVYPATDSIAEADL